MAGSGPSSVSMGYGAAGAAEEPADAVEDAAAVEVAAVEEDAAVEVAVVAGSGPAL